MARIRTIKPSFFTSQTIATLSYSARLTFIGLWTHVDDDGRCLDDARLIRAAVWPLDDRPIGEVDADLCALSDASLIHRYRVNERSYIAVCSWREHQVINRPVASKIPAPPQDTDRSVCDPGAVTEPHRSLTERSCLEGNGREEEGKGVERAVRAPLTLTRGQAAAGVQSLIALWNRSIEPPLKSVPTTLQPASSQRVVRALQAYPDLDWWEARIAEVRASDYLMGRIDGRNGTPFVADFWWLIEHVDKVEAGRYANRGPSKNTPAAEAERTHEVIRKRSENFLAIARGQA